MYKKSFNLVIAATLALASVSSFSESLKDSPVVFQSGNWKVLRSLDEMTDKVSCIGIYKEEYGIQLTDDTLYLSVRGGIESITLRFGEQPAQPLRLPKDIEKKINSVIVTGEDLNKLLNSNKLRFQVSTMVRGINSGELELTGINEAFNNIKAGCPIKPSIGKDKQPAGSLCSEALIIKMKSQGLESSQISSICENN